jgi:hypothetical protein
MQYICGGPGGQHWPLTTIVLQVWSETKLYFNFFFFETGSYYVAQSGLGLVVLLTPPPACWDYGCVQQCLT